MRLLNNFLKSVVGQLKTVGRLNMIITKRACCGI